MTDPEILPLTASKAARRTWRIVLAAGVVLVLGLMAIAYAGRRAVAREALTGWLRSQGMDSEVAFSTFGPGGFTGTLRIGPAADPDLTAQVAEVRYGLTGWWAGKPFGATVTSVRLVHPAIKGRWKDGRLSLGELDPLIAALRERPPRPDARQPRIVVEDARLRLDTDYGPLLARASARLDDGRLLRLDATFAPAELKGADRYVRLGPGELHLVTVGDQVASALETTVRDLKLGQVSARQATLRLTARTAYPDLNRKRGDGGLAQSLKVNARAVGYGATRLTEVSLEATFNGQSAGWIDTLAVTGDGTAVLGAARADLPGARVRDLRVNADVRGLNWTRRGGALHLAVSGGGLPQADLAVDRYRLVPGGLTAQTRLKASTGVGSSRGSRSSSAVTSTWASRTGSSPSVW